MADQTPPQPLTWQPIGSAPRDGTEITVGWKRDAEIACVRTAFWYADKGYWSVEGKFHPDDDPNVWRPDAVPVGGQPQPGTDTEACDCPHCTGGNYDTTPTRLGLRIPNPDHPYNLHPELDPMRAALAAGRTTPPAREEVRGEPQDTPDPDPDCGYWETVEGEACHD